jgi:hypothetical protein
MNGKAGVFSEDGGLITHRRCRLNKVLAKWGLMEVIQQGFFYQPFCYI